MCTLIVVYNTSVLSEALLSTNYGNTNLLIPVNFCVWTLFRHKWIGTSICAQMDAAFGHKPVGILLII